jgi:hypothetical protein
MNEAEHRFLVQCKDTNCMFNKKMYVPRTDTLQLCCGRLTDMIRLDENGKCIIGQLESCQLKSK